MAIIGNYLPEILQQVRGRFRARNRINKIIINNNGSL